MQHVLLDNIPTNMFLPLSFSALTKTPVFYSSYLFSTFPLLLLSSCFSMHTQREKHTVFLFRQRITLLARRTINAPFKNLSMAHLRTSKTAAEQPDITDALAVCPTPLKAEFVTKNRRKQQHRMFLGDTNLGTRERGYKKKCNSRAY